MIREYRPEYERMKKEHEEQILREQDKDLERIKKDMGHGDDIITGPQGLFIQVCLFMHSSVIGVCVCVCTYVCSSRSNYRVYQQMPDGR